MNFIVASPSLDSYSGFFRLESWSNDTSTLTVSYNTPLITVATYQLNIPADSVLYCSNFTKSFIETEHDRIVRIEKIGNTIVFLSQIPTIIGLTFGQETEQVTTNFLNLFEVNLSLQINDCTYAPTNAPIDFPDDIDTLTFVRTIVPGVYATLPTDVEISSVVLKEDDGKVTKYDTLSDLYDFLQNLEAGLYTVGLQLFDNQYSYFRNWRLFKSG